MNGICSSYTLLLFGDDVMTFHKEARGGYKKKTGRIANHVISRKGDTKVDNVT